MNDDNERAQSLTERQRREVEYHSAHSKLVRKHLTTLSYDVVYSNKRRWWNAYWDLFTYLRRADIADKHVLVVGCGSGIDAMPLAKMGAHVCAFDLSPDMIAIAREISQTEALAIDLVEAPAEDMPYGDDRFDIVFVRDILHHVEIPETMREIARVSKPGSLLVVNEIYSHSITERIRRSALVERFVYPRMQRFIYGGKKPYITQDERKLNELDVRLVRSWCKKLEYCKYFNCIVTRLLPDRLDILNRLDRMMLVLMGPLARFVAGRIAFVGRIEKEYGQIARE